MLDFIGKGDVLLVTRVDRLARSIGDLQDIVRTLKAKGASLESNGAADRHQHGCREVLPRYAWRFRRVRNQPAARASA